MLHGFGKSGTRYHSGDPECPQKPQCVYRVRLASDELDSSRRPLRSLLLAGRSRLHGDVIALRPKALPNVRNIA